MALIDKTVLLKKLAFMLESIQYDIQKAKYNKNILMSELETVQNIIAMVEKQSPIVNEKEVPREVVHTNSRAGIIYCFEWNECPVCRKELDDEFQEVNYCHNCGQKLQWNFEEESE